MASCMNVGEWYFRSCKFFLFWVPDWDQQEINSHKIWLYSHHNILQQLRNSWSHRTLVSQLNSVKLKNCDNIVLVGKESSDSCQTRKIMSNLKDGTSRSQHIVQEYAAEECSPSTRDLIYKYCDSEVWAHLPSCKRSAPNTQNKSVNLRTLYTLQCTPPNFLHCWSQNQFHRLAFLEILPFALPCWKDCAFCFFWSSFSACKLHSAYIVTKTPSNHFQFLDWKSTIQV